MRPACPHCKVALAKDRIKERHIDSLQGWLGYQRMRYRCHECEETYYPLDAELALSSGSRMSLQKEKQLALLAVHMPYAEAKKSMEDRETFGRKLYRLAGEPEAAMTRGTTFISDAARWLDELRDFSFPLATRIVDFWHVTEYLRKVANAFYEEGSGKAKT